jgi:ferredoxin
MGVEALRMGDTGAGRLAYFDFERASKMCIGCGACTQVCPTGAIRLEDVDGLRRTIITGTVVCEQPLLKYADAAMPTQTPAHRDFIRKRLPPHMVSHLDREISPSSARLRGDRPAV